MTSNLRDLLCTDLIQTPALVQCTTVGTRPSIKTGLCISYTVGACGNIEDTYYSNISRLVFDRYEMIHLYYLLSVVSLSFISTYIWHKNLLYLGPIQLLPMH